MKQTKIVATIGPASEEKDVLRRMIQAGMNVVRLNFSHNEHEWHREVVKRVRELSEELKSPVGILADLQGPRIRTAVEGEIEVKRGARVRLTEASALAGLPTIAEPTFALDLPGLVPRLKEGHAVLIEDGTVELRVIEVLENAVMTEAQNDGLVKNRKGVILPDSALTLSILSEKDKADLKFIMEEGIEYVGLSFVGSAQDIKLVQIEMAKNQSDTSAHPKLVAKIERKEAMKNLKEIVRAVDAVMVARGDLGIEMPESEVVILQKTIIRESLASAKPVIVATQMLKSMTENPRPTRAEVSDVSNAVIDHADAVMLSEESAMGKYPVETVAMMAEIIEKTEESPYDDLYQALDLNFRNEYAVMIRSVYELAQSYRAKAILALSMSGFTARLLSHFRPNCKIFVATNNRRTWNELALVWGVEPSLFEGDRHLETMLDRLMKRLKDEGKLKTGEEVAVFLGRTPDKETMKLVGIKQVR